MGERLHFGELLQLVRAEKNNNPYTASRVRACGDGSRTLC